MAKQDDVDTRARLLEAAERLFAEQGIDHPSLAELTKAAGLHNTGAVHYYFGGREELLAAIVDHHRAELDARRGELLDELTARGETGPDHVVRALVEPMIAMLDTARGRAFLSIQAQSMLRPRRRPAEPRPLSRRVNDLVGTESRPEPTRDLRADLAVDLVYAALARRAVLEAADGRDAGVGRDEFVRQLVGAVLRINGLDDRS